MNEPVYWTSDVTYLYLILAAALCTLLYGRLRKPPARALLVADAFGLAVFAVLGVRAGLETGVSPLVAVLMGAITGTVGGARRALSRDAADPEARARRYRRDRRSEYVRGVERVGGPGGQPSRPP